MVRMGTSTMVTNNTSRMTIHYFKEVEDTIHVASLSRPHTEMVNTSHHTV